MTTKQQFIQVIEDFLNICDEPGHNYNNQDKAEYIAECCIVWEIDPKEWEEHSDS